MNTSEILKFPHTPSLHFPSPRKVLLDLAQVLAPVGTRVAREVILAPRIQADSEAVQTRGNLITSLKRSYDRASASLKAVPNWLNDDTTLSVIEFLEHALPERVRVSLSYHYPRTPLVPTHLKRQTEEIARREKTEEIARREEYRRREPQYDELGYLIFH